jgi:prepilin-type N-terminal cleavage/methylation domain-containing protein
VESCNQLKMHIPKLKRKTFLGSRRNAVSTARSFERGVHFSRAQGSQNRNAFSLIEIIISIAIFGIVVTGMTSAYISASRLGDWAFFSAAADSLAQQRMEQTQAATWDILATPPIDQLVSSNFPTFAQPFNLPSDGVHMVYGTNKTTFITVSTNPAVRMVRVDCVWRFPSTTKLYTNTVVAYRSPD